MRTQIFFILQACFALACIAQYPSYSTYSEFSGLPYQNQTAQEKMDQLWTNVIANATSTNWYTTLQFAQFLFENVSITFDTYSDVLPPGRKKYIHTVGSIVQAELIAEPGTNYTGMFQGVDNVLLRLSTAKQVDPSKAPTENFVPGFAIKLLRDGVPSANLIAMYSVDGQDSFNYFRYNLSNHIPNPTSVALEILSKKFAEATPYIGTIGLKTWGQYDQTGKFFSDSEIDIPFQLIFQPTSEVHTLFPDTYQTELPWQLETIPTGTTLYDVFAVDEPGAEPVKIASLKTKSQFVTSSFGDLSLFFQHNYFEDDIALHPNWKNAVLLEPSLLSLIMKSFHA